MKEIPLLLVHGYPFDHTMWFSTIAALGANAKVIAPDLPGFGRTELPAGKKPSLDTVAGILAKVLDEQGHEKVVIAGMSMGGYIALAFAEKFRDRLAGLGLISSQSAADTTEVRQGRKEMIKKIRAEGPSAAIDGLLPKLFSGENAKNPDLASYATKAAMAAGADGLCWALQAMADRPDRTALVREMTVPVMIAHGTDDKIVPNTKARLLAESCQIPLYVELRGVGHASPLEAPDQIAAGLARFMNDCRRRATGA